MVKKNMNMSEEFSDVDLMNNTFILMRSKSEDVFPGSSWADMS